MDPISIPALTDVSIVYRGGWGIAQSRTTVFAAHVPAMLFKNVNQSIHIWWRLSLRYGWVVYFNWTFNNPKVQDLACFVHKLFAQAARKKKLWNRPHKHTFFNVFSREELFSFIYFIYKLSICLSVWMRHSSIDLCSEVGKPTCIEKWCLFRNFQSKSICTKSFIVTWIKKHTLLPTILFVICSRIRPNSQLGLHTQVCTWLQTEVQFWRIREWITIRRPRYENSFKRIEVCIILCKHVCCVLFVLENDHFRIMDNFLCSRLISSRTRSKMIPGRFKAKKLYSFKNRKKI